MKCRLAWRPWLWAESLNYIEDFLVWQEKDTTFQSFCDLMFCLFHFVLSILSGIDRFFGVTACF
jgi:hypothetical protein